MITRIFIFLKSNKSKISKFLTVGATAFVINAVLLHIFVAYAGMNTGFIEDIANFLSIEISVIYNFILSRMWTWKDREKKQGKGLIAQILNFHLAVGAGVSVRIVLYRLLNHFEPVILTNINLYCGSIYNTILHALEPHILKILSILNIEVSVSKLYNLIYWIKRYYHLLNMMIGVAIAMVFDFILYEKLVFKNSKK